MHLLTLPTMPPPITLGEPTHFETDSSITCIDTCRSKPLIFAGSSDGTVFLFHGQSRGKVLEKSLHDLVSSVALHPSGLAAAYSVSDQVCLTHVVDGDLHPFLELRIAHPSIVSFNRGGSVLAVVHGSRISLVDFVKAAKICDLGGIGANIVAATWSPCDSALYTLDEDATLNRWAIHLSDGNCTLECSQRLAKQPAGRDLAPSITLPTKGQVWVLADGTIQRFNASSLEAISDVNVVGSEKIKAMEASTADSSLVFVGVDTPGGHTLRLLSAIGDRKKILEDIPLEDSILHLHISEGDDALIVSGASGGLSVYAMTDHRRGDRSSCESKTAPLLDSTDTLLIYKHQLGDLTNAVDNLQRSINDSKVDHEFNFRRKENSIIEEIEKASAAFLEEGEDRAERLHSLEMEVIAKKLKLKREQREIAFRHAAETGHLEDEKRKELAEHVRTSKATEAFVTKELDRIQQERRILALEHRDKVQTLQSELEERFQAEHNTRVDLEKKLLALQEELGITQEVIEEELDAGIESIKKQYQEKLEAERDAALHLMSSNGILKKKIASAMAQIESNKDTVKNQLTVEENLKREESILKEKVSFFDQEFSSKASALEAQKSLLANMHEKRNGLERCIIDLENRSSRIADRIDRRQKNAADIDLQSAALTIEINRLDEKAVNLSIVAAKMQEEVKEKNQSSVGHSRKIAKQESYVQSLLGSLEDCRALVQRPAELSLAICGLESQLDVKPPSSSFSPPSSTKESTDEEEDDGRKETIKALEHKLSSLLREQAAADKRFRGQRDAVRQVNEKLLEKTSTAKCM